MSFLFLIGFKYYINYIMMKKFSYFNAFFIAVLIVSVYRNLFCNKFVSHKNEPKIGDRIKNNNS